MRLRTGLAALVAAAACTSSTPAVDHDAPVATTDGPAATVDATAIDAPPPAPPVGDPITGLTLGDGWTDPRALAAPVNTTGWEDSSYIAASGQRLYFGYTQWNYDALTHGNLVIDGPLRPGETRAAFEIYEATIANGAWTVVPSSVNSSDPNAPEASVSVDDAEATMAFVRYDGPAPNQGDIYLARKQGGAWGPPEKLPAPINSACIEDNTSLSADGTRLYFDSNRADVVGTACTSNTGSDGRTIYVSSFANGAWGAPVAVAGEPNLGAVHWQVYARSDETALYWAGFDTSCGGSSCLFRATRQPDGSYADRVVVVKAIAPQSAQVGDAYAVGEASITRDGRYLYFTYIQKTAGDSDAGPAGGSNLNIGVAHK